MRTLVRALLPASVRRTARRAHRDLVLRRALDAAQELAGTTEALPLPLARRLCYGWGNERFSVPPDFLAAIWAAAHRTCGPILECGSGLSSIVLGLIAERRGVRGWSLEHDADWARRTRATLDLLGITQLELLHARLRDYGGFEWYSDSAWEARPLPAGFALVVCDGPPGLTTRGGRVGLVPVMCERLLPGAVILLDDVERPGEREVVRAWVRATGATVAVRGDERLFAELVVPARGVPASTRGLGRPAIAL
ncbi:MAG TPA: hypothetical protein VFA44_10645 [Gaiellaceae bacterium]|nr:hypothetical protein [Gaiellaceae bacterium]